MTPRLDLALRRAAYWHRAQTRKATDTPYIQHPVAVAMIVDRLGFGEDVVIAALLHDVVEDTEATFEDVASEFGDSVVSLVRDLSEEKTDAQGRKRPWADRKRDHLKALSRASVPARAVALADRLHNLTSILADLRGNADPDAFWARFNAPKAAIFRQYRASIDVLSRGDPVLEQLGAECRRVLAEVEARS
ncbi:MAG TPA: HD domain-containing protein [Isosphaeraceae bacterium]|nr:HD domain-containing protein [Isosphaeraceae bacterium]